MRAVSVVMLAGVALLIWTGVSAQNTRPVPSFGSDTMPVSGTVSIGNTPDVMALQGGEWRVAIGSLPPVQVANTPTVIAASPDFLKVGRYTITWSTGESELVAVTQVLPSGWLRAADRNGRQRWVNVASARSIEEAR